MKPWMRRRIGLNRAAITRVETTTASWGCSCWPASESAEDCLSRRHSTEVHECQHRRESTVDEGAVYDQIYVEQTGAQHGHADGRSSTSPPRTAFGTQPALRPVTRGAMTRTGALWRWKTCAASSRPQSAQVIGEAVSIARASGERAIALSPGASSSTGSENTNSLRRRDP